MWRLLLPYCTVFEYHFIMCVANLNLFKYIIYIVVSLSCSKKSFVVRADIGLLYDPSKMESDAG